MYFHFSILVTDSLLPKFFQNILRLPSVVWLFYSIVLLFYNNISGNDDGVTKVRKLQDFETNHKK